MPTSSSVRVIQISDTHLVENPSFFLENWARLVHHINALEPDLIVHTGDLSFDGVQDEAQLELARDCLAQLDCESLALPGNHDVGELPQTAGELEPPISAQSCERFAAHLGQTRFHRDLGAWRLVGVNALLLGSGIDCEQEEWEHLEGAIASAGERRVALFLHKPLYIEGLNDASRPPNMLASGASRRLHELIRESRVELIGSGHLHEHRIAAIGNVRHVWSPSTGFVTDEILSAPIGTRRVGFVRYDLGPDDAEVEVICPGDMVTHLFLDHPDMYPRFQEAARRSIARRQSQ